jgi:hypothetical protein
MRITALEQSRQHISLTEQDLDLNVGPIGRRDFLHESKQFVKVHFAEFATELAHECRAHIDVKVFESIRLAQIGIPQTKNALEMEFTYQQAVLWNSKRRIARESI